MECARPVTATEDRNVDLVRALWTATHRDGIVAALRLVDPEVEWSLYFVPGRTFDTGELRDFLGKLQGERELLAAHLHRLQSKDNFVLASGSFRWGSIDGGLSDFQGHWLYEFDERRLARGRSYRTLGEALTALDGLGERTRSASSAE
jgi:ketosteroid isomerase-like protein